MGTKNFISPPLSSAGDWFLLAREHPTPGCPTTPRHRSGALAPPASLLLGHPKRAALFIPVPWPPHQQIILPYIPGGGKGVQQGFNSAGA